MKAFLLAAGLGTRLRPYTDTVPKCLMPVFDKTLLEIWLDLFALHGVTEVLINTSYLPEKVVSFVETCRNRYPFIIRLFHEDVLLGSAGTLWANRDWVAGEKDFMICYADNLTDLDLSRMVLRHSEFRKQGGVLTMGLFHAPNPSACGIASLDEAGRITAFEEKPDTPQSDLANAGIYVASDLLFDFFPAPSDAPAVLDFGYHILPKLAGRMFGYPVDGFLRDIGTVDAYHAALDQWGKRA